MQGSGLMKFWGISEEKRKTMPKIENLKCVEIENPIGAGAEGRGRARAQDRHRHHPRPAGLLRTAPASSAATSSMTSTSLIAARKTIVTCEELVSDEFIRRDPDQDPYLRRVRAGGRQGSLWRMALSVLRLL